MWPEERTFHELRRHLIEQRGIAWDAINEGPKVPARSPPSWALSAREGAPPVPCSPAAAVLKAKDTHPRETLGVLRHDGD